MLIFFASLSLIATVIIVITGLLVRKPEEQESSEKWGFWRSLGFVDETPNLIRAIVAGNEENGPIINYVGNVKGKEIRPDGKLKPKRVNTKVTIENLTNLVRNEISIQSWLIKTFGVRWIGLPYLRNVKPVYIDRVVRKDTEETPQEKIRLSSALKASKVKKYGLYAEFPRPTYHHELDTKDQVRFNILSTAIVEVEDARPFFEVYSDGFLQTISDIIGTFISNQVLKMDWETYKGKGEKSDKQLGTEKFGEAMEDLNLRLKPLGVKVKHLYISDPEISKAAEKMQEALEATRIAKEKANAKLAEADGEGGYIAKIAEAKTRRVSALMEMYVKGGMPAPEALRLATATVVAEINAEAVGKLTTYVAGGTGVQIGLPTEGGKK